MDKLSVEIVEHIASYMDAGSVMALMATCRAMRKPCVSRLSPERYLQKTFRQASSLLAAMADHGCVLSGSRALDYFVPGSTGEASKSDEGEELSDWDFLVPCVEGSVLGMMEALAACGVDWGDHRLSELMALPTRRLGTTAVVSATTAQRLLNQPYSEQMRSMDEIVERLRQCGTLGETEELPAEAERMLRGLHAFVNEMIHAEFAGVTVQQTLAETTGGQTRFRFDKVQRKSSNSSLGLLGEYGGYDMNSYGSMYGMPGANANQPNAIHLVNCSIMTSRTGRRAKVQLFQCHNIASASTSQYSSSLRHFRATTPLTYVLDGYYASHAVVWPFSEAQAPAVTKAVAKYRQRGFHFRHSGLLDLEVNSRMSTAFSPEASDSAVGRVVLELVAEAKAAHHLGQPGTLLVRFRRLEDRLAQQVRAPPDVLSAGRLVHGLYRHLRDAVLRFRFDFISGRPVAAEPVMPLFSDSYGTSHISSAHSRFLVHSDPPLSPYSPSAGFVRPISASRLLPALAVADAVPPAIPPVGVLTPGDPDWTRWKSILSLAPMSCHLTSCERHLKHKPPQI
ncbi:hypothetical protein CMQ_1811 [Grosmannia clavigera kw1407]|uniref:F-box domain-containing protein n=1 Tax=Grosmannia clavigera (strain kw1407 / UAMH 11150) TaxID=655863 RepID=F0XAZ0_GROCL|nr:uncharacterized protein CMQ_1811 [Grosmannia clavigera kw1407]EFX05175.1 hypothetical protein CMQ_1811 [Grosmannia clavigera kw1407]